MVSYTDKYNRLVEKNILIPHQTITENLTGLPNWHLTLQPEPIPFISYPYEWCFDTLKDAALLTLEAAKEAMNFGMMLKDASAYNIQLYKGKPIFIDSLSFEQYDKQKPWVAYRQFCEHFFAPLALMHYLKKPFQNLFAAHVDGIPLPLAKAILPFKSKFNLHSYLHLHLHTSLATKKDLKMKASGTFSKQKMQNLLQSLENGVRSFSFSERSGVWSDYYEEAHQRNDYITAKKEVVKKWLAQIPLESLLDAGANEGEFSNLVLDETNYIISADFDHCAVNKLYNKTKQKGITHIYPLLVDFSKPSPALGVNNQERFSFLQRTKVDAVLALALIHHLTIGKNIPFDKITELFSSIGKWLILEFVPREDKKIQFMLEHKKDLYSWYSETEFVKSFGKKFAIVEKQTISNTGRTLYLMKCNEI
jgi:hypothetical protein